MGKVNLPENLKPKQREAEVQRLMTSFEALDSVMSKVSKVTEIFSYTAQ